MNANELADELERLYQQDIIDGVADLSMPEAATMLRQQQGELDAFKLQYYNTGYSIQLIDKDETIRQQQAEIELLKANINSATKELLQQQDKIAELKHINKNWQISENILLLELEKLQHRELTDEEIYSCFHQYFVLGEPKPTHYELEYEDLIEFARAILRKAQEK